MLWCMYTLENESIKLISITVSYTYLLFFVASSSWILNAFLHESKRVELQLCQMALNLLPALLWLPCSSR